MIFLSEKAGRLREMIMSDEIELENVNRRDQLGRPQPRRKLIFKSSLKK
jgi:hypothetical protein